jgi:hypothetical protein
VEASAEIVRERSRVAGGEKVCCEFEDVAGDDCDGKFGAVRRLL